MSLVPSPTAPPDIGWAAAVWADDPINRANPNNALVSIDKIKAIYGNALLATTANTNPHFVTNSEYLGGRAAWVIDASTDGIIGRLSQDYGQQVTVVAVCALTAEPVGNGVHVAVAGNVSPVGLSCGEASLGRTVRIIGSNNDSRPYVRLPMREQFLYTGYTNRPSTGQARSSINGEQFTKGQLSNVLVTDTLSVGSYGSGTSISQHIGFFGLYQGDAFADPDWPDFLAWVQSHYGFDPTALYDTNNPPPISWQAEYLADDFDTSTGTWPDRTGRGTTLAPSASSGYGIGLVPGRGLYTDGYIGLTTQTALDGHILSSYTDFLDVKWKWAPGAGSVSSRFCMGVGEATPGSESWMIGMASGIPFVWYWDSTAVGSTPSGQVTPVGGVTLGPSTDRNSPQWWRLRLDWRTPPKTEITWYVGDGTTWQQVSREFPTLNNPLRTSSAPFCIGALPANAAGSAIGTDTFYQSTFYERVIVEDGTGVLLDVDMAAPSDWPATVTDSVSGKRLGLVRKASGVNTEGFPGPVKVDNVVNGQPVVRFDSAAGGPAGRMLKGTLGSTLQTPFTVVLIMRSLESWGALNRVFFAPQSGTARLIGTDGGSWLSNNGTPQYDGAHGTAPESWHMHRFLQGAGVTTYWYLDETTTLLDHVNNGTTDMTAFYVGGNGFGGGVGSMDVGFIGVFYGDVTASALWGDFKTWVTAKYGIVLS